MQLAGDILLVLHSVLYFILYIDRPCMYRIYDVHVRRRDIYTDISENMHAWRASDVVHRWASLKTCMDRGVVVTERLVSGSVTKVECMEKKRTENEMHEGVRGGAKTKTIRSLVSSVHERQFLEPYTYPSRSCIV
jgi:hypothetical protein